MTDAVIKAEDGNVNGKGMTTGGDVKITSDSGDIKISGSLLGNVSAKAEDGNTEIAVSGVKKSQCSYELSAEDGTVYIDGSEYDGSMRVEKADPKSNINGSSDSGDVRLIFK